MGEHPRVLHAVGKQYAAWQPPTHCATGVGGDWSDRADAMSHDLGHATNYLVLTVCDASVGIA